MGSFWDPQTPENVRKSKHFDPARKKSRMGSNRAILGEICYNAGVAMGQSGKG
jgi:hypothetical protein